MRAQFLMQIVNFLKHHVSIHLKNVRNFGLDSRVKYSNVRKIDRISNKIYSIDKADRSPGLCRTFQNFRLKFTIQCSPRTGIFKPCQEMPGIFLLLNFKIKFSSQAFQVGMEILAG